MGRAWPLVALALPSAVGLGEGLAGNCGGCYSASFLCARDYCDRTRDRQVWTLDLRHASEDCRETIPLDDRSVHVDLDVWCAVPDAKTWWEPPLTCETSHKYELSGVGELDGCREVAFASSLVRESCSWHCKDGRPTVRCAWHLGYDELYREGERLEWCNRTYTCGSDPREPVRLDFACRPRMPGNQTVESYLALLKQRVATANATLAAAEPAIARAWGEENRAHATSQRDIAASRLGIALAGLQAFEQVHSADGGDGTLARLVAHAARYRSEESRGVIHNRTILQDRLEKFREAQLQAEEWEVGQVVRDTPARSLAALSVLLALAACAWLQRRRRLEKGLEEPAYGVVVGRPGSDEAAKSAKYGNGSQAVVAAPAEVASESQLKPDPPEPPAVPATAVAGQSADEVELGRR